MEAGVADNADDPSQDGGHTGETEANKQGGRRETQLQNPTFAS